MRLLAFMAAALLLGPGGAMPGLAQEALPDCGVTTVGVDCIARRDQIGPWELAEVVPPVGTQNALMLTTPSFAAVPGIFGREEPAILSLSCVENVTRLEVRFGENFMSDVGDFGRVVYKVDASPPVPVSMTASEDNFALGIYSGDVSIPLIVKLFEHELLLVNATSFTGRNITASFSIKGVEAAVGPLRTLCNW